MPNPLYGLILGNIAGVRDPKWARQTKLRTNTSYRDNDKPETYKETGDKNHPNHDDNTTAAVETRAQKIKRTEDLRPLRVPEAQSFSEIKQAQNNGRSNSDQMLETCPRRYSPNNRPSERSQIIFFLNHPLLAQIKIV